VDTKDDPLELYQAFHIGLMIAATLRDEEFTVQRQLTPALDMLRMVAESGQTLHDPQQEATKNPATASFTSFLAPLVFQMHRDLAAKILRSKGTQFQVKEIKP
jgi:hypothetical protein